MACKIANLLVPCGQLIRRILTRIGPGQSSQLIRRVFTTFGPGQGSQLLPQLPEHAFISRQSTRNKASYSYKFLLST